MLLRYPKKRESGIIPIPTAKTMEELELILLNKTAVDPSIINDYVEPCFNDSIIIDKVLNTKNN